MATDEHGYAQIKTRRGLQDDRQNVGVRPLVSFPRRRNLVQLRIQVF